MPALEHPLPPDASAPHAGLVRVGFASRDGQSRKIATHIAERLQADGLAAETLDLAAPPPVAQAVAGATLMVVVAAVRYGHHLKEADTFLKAYRAHANAPPLALASVNLTARKPEKQTPETNAYIKKLIARHDLRPVVAAVFAGRLDYPRYRWFDRNIIRLIMWLTGGPTDGTSTIEYTSWPSVDAFAGDILGAARTARETRA
ncbi:menaquinone-dependent protoporphyrinogen IX dehydrogenase [Roseospira visakhapatnamensis]|uniref:Protoporphyrinogen IX dehydrogenase [quinone] n=1 Tax=Roseospira visakhapatnamensis TaxID=390880 RepID=A0A7W6W8S3_9PROT|nr:menaquinone-dependent protoporphyrinogen IX dehydrogenase [Roseospira visakhapatnamensis]MBB4264677.1 menaquinone-dependent protoporphyrinogen oxidase [Roseospira visakhapatnamensis]